TPGDALTAGRADTLTPRQLTATRRSLPCSFFLTPALAAARAAPDTTALLSGTTHGQSAPRPSPAYRAAIASRSPYRWWAGTGAGAGVGWHAASRSCSSHGTGQAADATRPRPCITWRHAAPPRPHVGEWTN